MQIVENRPAAPGGCGSFAEVSLLHRPSTGVVGRQHLATLSASARAV